MSQHRTDLPQPGMTLLPNQGPWGSRGTGGDGNNSGSGSGGDNNGGKAPWGGPRKSGGNEPPDLDDMLRSAQDKFKNRFNGGRPGNGAGLEPARVFGILLVVVLLFWIATGFYTVQPGENAVILTFGKLTDTKTEAGLGYHMPWPIQESITEPVSANRQLNVGFGGDTSNDLPQESVMLTGDENIVNIHFSIFWHVSDAAKYLFEVQNPDDTVKKVAESAMREVIGHTKIQDALTEGRGQIETSTRDLMQKTLDEYNSGVSIIRVQLLSVDPPQPVVDAFNDVQRARTDQERMKNEAEAYSNNIVPVAKGEAGAVLQKAEAYKAATIAKAEGDAARFNSVYKAYSEAKDVTQKRMYLETMQQILASSRKIILGDDKGAPVLPYLQLDAKGARIPAPPQPEQDDTDGK